MEVLECRRRFPPANNHLSCIWGLSWLDNSFSKSQAVKPPTGLMWQKKTRTPPASGSLCSAVLQASGIEEGKRILLENPIRERRKYALLRERESWNKFSPHPQAKDFDINKGIILNKGKSCITLTCFRKPVFLLRKQTLQVNRQLFPPKVQFSNNKRNYDYSEIITEVWEIRDLSPFLLEA